MDPVTLSGGSLIFGIVCAIACNFIAKNKGRGRVLWTVLGFLFSIVSLIIVLVLPKKN
ncbi:hypothetical protein LWF01_06205 [Saxibacter everestensis]|uniref:Uncharacterized protein n=1 Tax=Saxibacter everestensis TaxID=2909229 RepID=A0ABY8QX23_9MICO|nr:hypothetical protein LWF01_06205 [Brevibacteriaceae bacterium ZFBP1038]